MPKIEYQKKDRRQKTVLTEQPRTMINVSTAVGQSSTTQVNKSVLTEQPRTMINVSTTVGQSSTTQVNKSVLTEQPRTMINVSTTVGQSSTTQVNKSVLTEQPRTMINVSTTVGQSSTTQVNKSGLTDQSRTMIDLSTMFDRSGAIKLKKSLTDQSHTMIDLSMTVDRSSTTQLKKSLTSKLKKSLTDQSRTMIALSTMVDRSSTTKLKKSLTSKLKKSLTDQSHTMIDLSRTVDQSSTTKMKTTRTDKSPIMRKVTSDGLFGELKCDSGHMDDVNYSSDNEYRDTENAVDLFPTQREQYSIPRATLGERAMHSTSNRITQGSYSQANEKYGFDNRNSQCVANSLSSMMHSKLKPINTWRTNDLDKVLDDGDMLYSQVKQEINTSYRHLLVSELPQQAEIDNSTFKLFLGESLYGVLGDLPEGVDIDFVVSFKDALNRTLATSYCCFLTFLVQTFAVIKCEGRYFVFDSHSRNAFGMSCSEGNSVILEKRNISEVCDHFQKLAMSMTITPHNEIQFEITGMNIDVVPHMSNYQKETTQTNKMQDQLQQQHIGSDDISVLETGVSKNAYSFTPLHMTDFEAICCKLGVNNCQVPVNVYNVNNMGSPSVTDPIQPDGNCYFRSIAKAVSGTESNHIRIRRLVVKHMVECEQLFVNHLRCGHNSITQYIKKSRMKYSGIWATEVEILATAHLIKTDIYAHTDNKWIRFSADQVEKNCGVNTRAIYLKHFNSHYDVVSSVNSVVEETCAVYIQAGVQSQIITGSVKPLIQARRKKGIESKQKIRRAAKQHQRNLKIITQVEQKRQHERSKYHDHEQLKRRKIQKSMEKYALDDKFNQTVKTMSKQKYNSNPEHQEFVKKTSIFKYKTDKEHQERVKQASVFKYSTDKEHRDNVKQASVFKYSTDKEHCDNVKQASVFKYSTEKEHRDSVKQASISKYKTDEEHQEYVKRESKRKYRENPEHLKELVTIYRSFKTLQKNDINNVTLQFKEDKVEGPDYVCTVCHRLLFRKQVVNCNKDGYNSTKLSSEVSKIAITDKYLHQCTNSCEDYCELTKTSRSSSWICYTCHRKLQKGKLPPEAAVNNLELRPIPSQLKCLNSLEQHLISLHIPFMKLLALPKGKQNAVVGPVVCVPSDMSKSASILPRCETDDQLIRVKLKRRMSYEGHYEYQFVKKSHVENALKYLKENNKWYTDIQIDPTWENPFSNDETDVEIDSIMDCNEDQLSSQGLQPNNDNDDELPNLSQGTGLDSSELPDIHVEQKLAKGMESDSSDELPDIHVDQKLPKGTESDSSDELPDIHVDQNLDIEDECDAKLKGPLLDTCMQPVDIGQEILDQYSDDILSVAPAEENSPIEILAEHSNEAKSFPVLFPVGSPTFLDDRREKLTLSRYLNNRLMNADNRFAKDINYIFHAQFRSEIQQVRSSISIALRKGNSKTYDKAITAEMLADKDILKDIMKADEGWKYLKDIRATPAYWQTSQKDVFAMLRQLGIPTWFASFSSADMRWSEFVELILRQQGDTRKASHLDWAEKCEVLRSNPVTVARLFEHRFQLLLKNVILSPAAPIGKIKDYFYRVEFQQRGSPHTHCLFWVESAPKLDRENDEEIVNFIDQYITCELPPVDDDDELHNIVTSVQTHSSRHSKSCRKKGTTCRFNFPRPTSIDTFINRPKEKDTEMKAKAGKNQRDMPEMDTIEMTAEQAKDLLGRIWDIIKQPDLNIKCTEELFSHAGTTQEVYQKAFSILSKKTSIVLKRKPCDIWINPYNADLIRCWDANLDIQYIVDAYSCVIYVVSYLSKSEREMSMLLSQTEKEIKKDGNLDAKAAMKKIGTVYLHNREVSAQEAVYRVLNLHLKECSRKVIFIPIGEEPIKMSLPLSVLKNRSSETNTIADNIWMTSLVDRYKSRPMGKKFGVMCLATFCSEFRILYGAEAEKASVNNTTVFQLQNGLGFIQKRTRSNPAVIRYPRFSASRTPEKYYHSILQLFLPHRNDNQLKPPNHERYQDFYISGSVCCKGMKRVKELVDSNRSLYEIESDRLDNAQELLDQLGDSVEDSWATICSETEKKRIECENHPRPNLELVDEITEGNLPDLLMKSGQTNRLDSNPAQLIISREEAEPLLRSLNEQQAEIFYKIRQWCLDKVSGKKPDPFHAFVTGGAGTGKSHLIKCVFYDATRVLRLAMPNPDDISVMLTAPTGVAAFNIGASTLHSAFAIRTDVKLPYQPLGEDKVNTLRAKLENLQILIIDEISMVDHKMLTYIHGRLRQIKQTRDYSPFGKVSVLAVGDFYQLPPVKGTALYVDNMGIDLWSQNFEKTELTEIMRQKDDKDFASLLNRARTVTKKDKLNQADTNTLQDRETGKQPTDALYIFATNAEVDEHNLNIMESTCPNPVIIEAADYIRDPRTGQLERKEKHHSQVYNTSLPKCVTLAVGARVMLIKNLDVSDGLVNGAFGVVTKISIRSPALIPSSVQVLFDSKKTGQKAIQNSQTSHDGSITIEPQEDVVNNKGGVRKQFPLKLAWACTVHKTQGLTVKKSVVSLKKIFAPGQAYVALSRVTSSEGLTIRDFKSNTIYCNPQIKQALSEMPLFIKPVIESSPKDATSSILYHNVQSLYAHIDDIKNDPRFTRADFICMTETWLTPQSSQTQFKIEGFHLHHTPRATSYNNSQSVFSRLKAQSHGGVGIYVSQSQRYEELNVPPNLECAACVLPDRQIIIAVVYRPPSYPVTQFMKALQKLLKQIEKQPLDSIIMGDFNQDISKDQSSSIVNLMAQNGYTQIVNQSTTEDGTLIDHVYTKSDQTVTATVLPTYFSFHEAIQIKF